MTAITNRRVLRIAVPIVVSNATIPLLGAADTAMDELARYFLDLVAHHRDAPRDDVVSALLVAHEGPGERLSQDELVGNMMLMLTAGFETTSFLLGYALLLAFQHPEHAQRLRTDPLAVADEVRRILVARPRVVLRAHPVVEAVIPRLRLVRLVEAAVEMPLADVARRIAGLFEERRDRDFVARQVHRVPLGNPVVNADAAGRPASHQPGPRR